MQEQQRFGKKQLPQRSLSALGVFRSRQFHMNVRLSYAGYLYLTTVLHKSCHTKPAQSPLEKRSRAEAEHAPKTLGDRASASCPDEAFCQGEGALRVR